MAFTPINLISRARRLYNVSVDQWSAEDALADLNELKNDFLATLINSAEDGFNWQTWFASTVSLQGEYSLPSIGASTAWAKQIKQVSVAYSGETYAATGKLKFEIATEVSPSTLDRHWSWFEENWPSSSPIYFVADDALHIAPVPRASEAGANRIELRGIESVPDYAWTETEAEMKFPVDVQQLFVQGLESYALRSKWMDRADVNSALTEFERLQKRKVSEMTAKKDSADFMSYPTESSDVPVTIG